MIYNTVWASGYRPGLNADNPMSFGTLHDPIWQMCWIMSMHDYASHCHLNAQAPLLASHWHWQYWVSADIYELKLFRSWSFQLDLADECCVQLSSMSGCYKLSKGCKYSRLKPYQATDTALKGRMCLPWPKSIYTDRQCFWCLTGVWFLCPEYSLKLIERITVFNTEYN